MKKIFIGFVVLISTLTLVACSNNIKENDIKVAVAFSPMDAILDLIKDDVKKDGYNLTYEMFNGNYYTPNVELQNGNFTANMIQHAYFMEAFNQGNNGTLVHAMNIYHAKFGLYSKTQTKPESMPNNSKIAIPKDSTNLARALLLLADTGVIKLKDESLLLPTLNDIINDKNLVFEEFELASIATMYKDNKDIDYVVMYPTNATMLPNNGNDDLVYSEDPTKLAVEKFGISLVSREDNKDSKKLEILKKHLKSDKVRQYIIDEYSWASIPSF